jgi:hypothetical protein
MKRSLLFALIALGFASVESLAAESALPPSVPPIRFATARMVITKEVMSFNASTGKSDYTADVICNKTTQVPVYDLSSPDSAITMPQGESCDSEIDGKKVTVKSQAYISYTKHALYKGAPMEAFKSVSTWSGVPEANAGFTPPPSQYVTSRDLRQQNFIVTARPDQYVMCSYEIGKQDCEVTNPVIFSVLWDIQDSAQ